MRKAILMRMIAGIAKRKLTWKDLLEGKATGLIFILLKPLPEENGLKLAAWFYDSGDSVTVNDGCTWHEYPKL